ncbi:MAG: hypothetical protein H0U65_04290 [Rubrobacter sp.]|nr:hypothetical protein [Rubrobacter sp.]
MRHIPAKCPERLPYGTDGMNGNLLDEKKFVGGCPVAATRRVRRRSGRASRQSVARESVARKTRR